MPRSKAVGEINQPVGLTPVKSDNQQLKTFHKTSPLVKSVYVQGTSLSYLGNPSVGPLQASHPRVPKAGTK